MKAFDAGQECAVRHCDASSSVIIYGQQVCSHHGSRLFDLARKHGWDPVNFRGDVAELLAALNFAGRERFGSTGSGNY